MSFHCDSLPLFNVLKHYFLFFVFLSEICVISELEDLSASVDVQDVYTKIKCKVVSFNIDHYRCRYSTIPYMLIHLCISVFLVTFRSASRNVMSR